MQYICPFWSLQWHITTKGGHSLSALRTICSYKLRKGQSHSHKHRSQVVGSQMLSSNVSQFFTHKKKSLFFFSSPWLNKEFIYLRERSMKLNWTATSYKLLKRFPNLSLFTQQDILIYYIKTFPPHAQKMKVGERFRDICLVETI